MTTKIEELSRLATDLLRTSDGDVEKATARLLPMVRRRNDLLAALVRDYLARLAVQAATAAGGDQHARDGQVYDRGSPGWGTYGNVTAWPSPLPRNRDATASAKARWRAAVPT